MTATTRRRTYLAGMGILLGGVFAGCSESSGPATSGEPTSTESPPTDTASETEDDLDLREANVVAVTVEPVDGGWRFDVTLLHDDGEDGYANWWQVETREGESLGRRELLHAHGTREFTRSKTISIPDTVSEVVRGHDQTHGYGGQAMIVTLESGETKAVQQGSEPDSFS